MEASTVETTGEAADAAAPGPSARPTTFELLATPTAAVVFIAGLLLRIWIINTTRGNLIADEAYTGLQSAAVLDGRFPVVIDGLTYTAPFDSYVLAPITAIVGQDVVLLKLFPSLAWGIASVLVVAIVRRIASDRAAVLAGSMVWLAPGSLAVIATRAYQSYASGMMSVAATTLGVVAVLAAARERDDQQATAWRSAVAGGLAGFAFYLHPMYIAVLLPMLLVPCWRFRSQWRSWWLPAVGAAVLVNVPFLYWNATNGWPSLEQPAEATDTAVDRLQRYGTGLVTRAYGVRGQEGDWIFGQFVSVVLVVALVGLAVYGAVRLMRLDRDLGLVIVAPLAVSWLLMSAFTNTAFVLDGRYAIINFPFVVIAVAVGAVGLLPDRRWAAPAAIVVWFAVFSVPHQLNDTGTEFHDANAEFRQIVDLLESRGVERVSGTYWWVLPIELLSDQEIRSSVAGNPFVILLPETQRLVDTTPDEELAFVLWTNGDDPNLLRMPVENYERIPAGGAVVYVPIAS